MAKLTFYYDGLCKLCEKECRHYKKVDKENRIDFIDISDESFKAQDHNLDPQLIQKYLHAKDKDGRIVQGVEAFYLIWKELEIFYPLQIMYRTPIFNSFMHMGYYLFAHIRPYLPKKEKCAEDVCKHR